MVSPQKEDGYTAIANEILEELVKVRLPASEKDLLFFIIRKTYGYNKKEDRISLTQFTKYTDLSRVTVIKGLRNLTTRNMVVKRGLLFSFNKHYDSWVVNPRLLVKSENVFGKVGYTKIGKVGYTHKRQKKTKEKDFETKSHLSELNKKPMRYYDEETGEYGEIPKSKKNRIPKNKLAIQMCNIFQVMCKDNLKVTPILDKTSYFIVLDALKYITPEKMVDLFEDWFRSGKEKQDLIQITQALSHNNINRFNTKQ